MKYKTKPFEIEAVQFTGDNWEELERFCGVHSASYNPFVDIPNFSPVENYWPSHTYSIDIVAVVWDYLHETWVGVHANDFIIRGSRKEYYPCDPIVFDSKYEPKFADGGRIESIPVMLNNGCIIPKKLTDDNKE